MNNVRETIRKIENLNIKELQPCVLISKEIMCSNVKKNLIKTRREKGEKLSDIYERMGKTFNSYFLTEDNEVPYKYNSDTINNLVNKKQKFRLRDIYCFCKYLNLTPEELLFNIKPEDFFSYYSFALPCNTKTYFRLMELIDTTITAKSFDLSQLSLGMILSELIDKAPHLFDKIHLLNIGPRIITDESVQIFEELKSKFNFEKEITKLINEKQKLNKKNSTNLVEAFDDFYDFSLIDEYLVLNKNTNKQIVDEFIDTIFKFDKMTLSHIPFVDISLEYNYHNNVSNYDLNVITISQQLENFIQPKNKISKISELNRFLNITSHGSLQLRSIPNFVDDETPKILNKYFDRFNPDIDCLLELSVKLNMSLTELLYKKNKDTVFDYKKCLMDLFIFDDSFLFLPNDSLNNFVTYKDYICRFIENDLFIKFYNSFVSFVLLNVFYLNTLLVSNYPIEEILFNTKNPKFITEEEADAIDCFLINLTSETEKSLNISFGNYYFDRFVFSYEKYNASIETLYTLFVDILKQCWKIGF